MSLFAPLWLILLIPWIGLVIYLVMAHRRRVRVPFVDLWRGPVQGQRTEPAAQRPPVWVMLVLVALLGAIFAAARPTVFHPFANAPIKILFDNGVTMYPHHQATVDRAFKSILQFTGAGPVEFIRADTGETITTDRSGWAAYAGEETLCPIDTRGAMLHRISARAQSDLPMFVISNQQLPIDRPGIFQISSQTPARNAGFVHLSLREEIRPQLMARIRNQSPLANAMLTIIVRDQTVSRPIQLPAPGQTQDYFVDLPEFSEQIEARIDAVDDLGVDNVAFLVRSGAWPSIEVRGDVGEPVRRMVDVYSRNRPQGDGSRPVVICTSLFQLSPDERGAAIVPPGEALLPLSRPIGIEFGEHPLLRLVDWKTAMQSARAARSPGEGWEILLRSGELVLLACRPTPQRQIWIGFDSPSFAATKDFVIFWTNALDWLGQGGASFDYEPLGALNRTATIPDSPGIYQRATGARVAMNVVDVKLESDTARLTRLPQESQFPGFKQPVALAPWLILLSLLLLAAAIVQASSHRRGSQRKKIAGRV